MSDPEDGALAGYWPGRWPCEDGGPRRTQAPARGGGIGLLPEERLVARSRVAPVGCMTITRDPGEVYLLGHSGPPRETTAWVERIDPQSLDAVRRSPALAAGPFWPGGIAAHRNGSLYVTYGRWCHRLEGPDSPSQRNIPPS